MVNPQEQIDFTEIPGIVSTRIGDDDVFNIDIVDRNLNFQLAVFNNKRLHTVAQPDDLFYLIRFKETAGLAKYAGKRENVIICAYELMTKVQDSKLMGDEFTILPVHIIDVAQDSTLITCCHDQNKFVIKYLDGAIDFVAVT